MSKIQVNHIQTNSFVSAAASGAIITGPTADGFIQVTFHRDVIQVMSESFEVPEDFPPGSAIDPSTVEFVHEQAREEVARILVPVARFATLVGAMSKRLEMLQKENEPTSSDV